MGTRLEKALLGHGKRMIASAFMGLWDKTHRRQAQASAAELGEP